MGRMLATIQLRDAGLREMKGACNLIMEPCAREYTRRAQAGLVRLAIDFAEGSSCVNRKMTCSRMEKRAKKEAASPCDISVGSSMSLLNDTPGGNTHCVYTCRPCVKPAPSIWRPSHIEPNMRCHYRGGYPESSA